MEDFEMLSLFFSPVIFGLNDNGVSFSAINGGGLYTPVEGFPDVEYFSNFATSGHDYKVNGKEVTIDYRGVVVDKKRISPWQDGGSIQIEGNWFFMYFSEKGSVDSNRLYAYKSIVIRARDIRRIKKYYRACQKAGIFPEIYNKCMSRAA
ncbi:MAG: hypothetical protein V1819_00255 [bacterium]